jgi:spermidine dehydrogenase
MVWLIFVKKRVDIKMKDENKTKLSVNSKSITRRDFVGGTMIGTGMALLSAKAPVVMSSESGQRPPISFAGLTKDWTGPGGIGDYASSNGNTHSVVNAAHSFRDLGFKQQVSNALELNEEYDLVVVGAGFAGCSAAYYYLKEHPSAKVLVLDNHAMFGGEARQNEFDVDGYKLWGPQGSTGAVWPIEKAKVVGMYGPIWEELGLPMEFKWQEPTNSKLKIPYDTYSPMHINWEAQDLGWFHENSPMAINPWSNRFKDVPTDERTKQDLLWMEVYRQPPERDDWAEWLDSMTYKEFLISEMGIDNPAIDEYLNPFAAAMGTGLGTDVISAYQAFNFLQPGVTQYGRAFGRMGLGGDPLLGTGDASDYIYLASFPGGNTGILRHIVQRLIPQIFGETKDINDVLSNPVDWNIIDEPSQTARMRLSSLVVNVKHDGTPEDSDRVLVTYLKGGQMYRVSAQNVVMAGQQHLNKRVVTDLPSKYKEAMDSFHHSPMMIINVALRNWKFMESLGVASVRWFGDDLGWFTTLRRQMILDGQEPMPLDPSKPTVLTMYNSFCLPGMPVKEQCAAARMKMFAMSYADIEHKVVQQFTKMFGAGGFDADKDIAGITVNRQGHAYVVTPPGFFFNKNGEPTASDVIREKHGRIAFAHAELKGYQMWEGAVHEGERAAHQSG